VEDTTATTIEVGRREHARPGVASGVRLYAELTKPKQTALLMATGIGAYLMSVTGAFSWREFAFGMGALAAAISGSTALNMVIDRDIDGAMARTAARPLPTGAITPSRALVFALSLAVVGLGTAWGLGALFGAAVMVGLVFDVVVYSLWLKRRTAASILVGGISGGMPAIAGRALATGRVDLLSVLLAAGVVLWIPAHILTLSMRHAGEYRTAGVPVWPGVHGEQSTRRLIAGATAGAALVLFLAGAIAGVHPAALAALALAGVGLATLALIAFAWPSDRRNWALFKIASVYMLFAFGCLTFGALA
jgi:protoheme IX farnesyltransferase